MDYEREIWIKKENLRIEIRNSVKIRDKSLKIVPWSILPHHMFVYVFLCYFAFL